MRAPPEARRQSENAPPLPAATAPTRRRRPLLRARPCLRAHCPSNGRLKSQLSTLQQLQIYSGAAWMARSELDGLVRLFWGLVTPRLSGGMWSEGGFLCIMRTPVSPAFVQPPLCGSSASYISSASRCAFSERLKQLFLRPNRRRGGAIMYCRAHFSSPPKSKSSCARWLI